MSPSLVTWKHAARVNRQPVCGHQLQSSRQGGMAVGKAGNDQADVSLCSHFSKGALSGGKPGQLRLADGSAWTRLGFKDQESTVLGTFASKPLQPFYPLDPVLPSYKYPPSMFYTIIFSPKLICSIPGSSSTPVTFTLTWLSCTSPSNDSPRSHQVLTCRYAWTAFKALSLTST